MIIPHANVANQAQRSHKFELEFRLLISQDDIFFQDGRPFCGFSKFPLSLFSPPSVSPIPGRAPWYNLAFGVGLFFGLAPHNLARRTSVTHSSPTASLAQNRN